MYNHQNIKKKHIYSFDSKKSNNSSPRHGNRNRQFLGLDFTHRNRQILTDMFRSEITQILCPRSGKLTVCYGKSLFLMDKSTISMAIFNSYFLMWNNVDMSPKWKSSGWWLTYPSEKYDFVSWDHDIHNIWNNKNHVPNHQPVVMFGPISRLISCETIVDNPPAHWLVNTSDIPRFICEIQSKHLVPLHLYIHYM